MNSKNYKFMKNKNECISFQSPFLVQCHVNDGKFG